MVDYRNGLWHNWFGGSMPVLANDVVKFFVKSMVEDDYQEARTRVASQLDFSWIDDPSDIVKFRVIEKTEEV